MNKISRFLNSLNEETLRDMFFSLLDSDKPEEVKRKIMKLIEDLHYFYQSDV